MTHEVPLFGYIKKGSLCLVSYSFNVLQFYYSIRLSRCLIVFNNPTEDKVTLLQHGLQFKLHVS
jgi:hypothetical protein